MPNAESIAFLADAAGRGATVCLLGPFSDELRAALLTTVGGAGLVVACDPAPVPAAAGVAIVRASLDAVPIGSHAADVVILPRYPSRDAAAVAEECRRLLAPRGVLRLLLYPDDGVSPDDAAATLTAAAFRDIASLPLGAATGISARGPR